VNKLDQLSYLNTMILPAQLILPFSLLPIVLAGFFVLIWAFIAWLKFREHLHATRHEHEARSHVVSVRKVGPHRTRVDHVAG
jgi:hypothetical protein